MSKRQPKRDDVTSSEGSSPEINPALERAKRKLDFQPIASKAKTKSSGKSNPHRAVNKSSFRSLEKFAKAKRRIDFGECKSVAGADISVEPRKPLFSEGGDSKIGKSGYAQGEGCSKYIYSPDSPESLSEVSFQEEVSTDTKKLDESNTISKATGNISKRKLDKLREGQS